MERGLEYAVAATGVTLLELRTGLSVLARTIRQTPLSSIVVSRNRAATMRDEA